MHMNGWDFLAIALFFAMLFGIAAAALAFMTYLTAKVVL